jgi:hypothetical protein
MRGMKYKKLRENTGLKQIALEKFQKDVEFLVEDLYEEEINGENHEEVLKRYKREIKLEGPFYLVSVTYPDFNSNEREIESYLFVEKGEKLKLYQTNIDMYFNDDSPIFITCVNEVLKGHFAMYSEPYRVMPGSSDFREIINEVKKIVPDIETNKCFIVSHN